MPKCLLYVAVTNCSIYVHSFAGKQALRKKSYKKSLIPWYKAIVNVAGFQVPAPILEYLLICFWDKTQHRASSSIWPPSIHSFTHQTQVAPICESYCLLAGEQTFFFIFRKQASMQSLVREIWVKQQNYLLRNNRLHVGEWSHVVVMQLRSSYLLVSKRLSWCWGGTHCSCMCGDAHADKRSRLSIA